jgi:sodium/potassium-transporting ATPase subunit alpha
LPTEYANQKRKEFGRNVLSTKNVIPWYCIFINEITGYFSLLLWLGSLLCFLAYVIRENKDSTNK